MKTRILLTGIAAVMIAASQNTVNATPVSTNVASPVYQVASNPPSFVSFRTHRFGRAGATASWSIDNPSGVTGFILQRTYEDPTDPYSVWDDINAIPCGNLRNFRVNDSNLAPGFVSYRVVMMNGGTPVGMSDVSTIQIVQH